MRFLLAIPRLFDTSAAPLTVVEPHQVCSCVPTLWHESGTPCSELAERGLVLGVAFSRSTFQRAEAPEMLAANGQSPEQDARHILSKFWGGYLAVLRDPADGSWTALCDPSGLFPVYRCVTRDHVLLASDPASLAAALNSGLSVSYPALSAHLLRPELRQRVTCLDGVEELVPGALYRLDRPDEACRPLWKAREFLPHGKAPTFSEAAAQLNELSRSVLCSWSGVFGHVSVATSGGVDSSLICAALAAGGCSFECITVATSDPSGDERAYAREVAAAFGVRCTERLYDPTLFDPAEPASAGLPRPARRTFLSVLDTVLIDAMRGVGTAVVLDGNGGDNLFCFLHSSAPLVDRIQAEGINVGTARTLVDMCRITGCSLPTMLKATARRLVGRRKTDFWPVDTQLLTRDAAQFRGVALTSWLEDLNEPRTGMHDHLALIMHCQNHIHGLTAPLPRFSPLMSQPILEFCLGVPTWIWAEGGRNRALARAAFAADLPDSILARTSKAGPDSFIRAAFGLNRDAIRKRLLDGLLVANGVIDRPAVEQAMSVDESSDKSLVDRLLDLLEAENWARSWTP